jgi:hypothetical protein
VLHPEVEEPLQVDEGDTAEIDRNEKKDLYGRIWRTPEYFLYEPETLKLEGFRLAGGSYHPLAPDGQGRLWSEQLGVSLGLWRGVAGGREDDWVRLFRPDGSLVPTEAEAERQRADDECQRATVAEAEVDRLRALIEELGKS